MTLRVGAGERVALVGPNGAGKSTLLRVIAGTARADRRARSASAATTGRDLERREVARRLAVVPQLATLPFAMRGRGGRGARAPAARGTVPRAAPGGPRRRGRAPSSGSGVGGLLGRDARELSLGERQLVLLAMAVAQAAPVLLLDEPTVHLDLRHQVEAMELLVDLNERDGTTIVAVLHDLGLAAHFFPRLVLLDRGVIVADGRPAEVLSPDRLRAVFGVDPAMAGLGG